MTTTTHLFIYLCMNIIINYFYKDSQSGIRIWVIKGGIDWLSIFPNLLASLWHVPLKNLSSRHSVRSLWAANTKFRPHTSKSHFWRRSHIVFRSVIPGQELLIFEKNIYRSKKKRFTYWSFSKTKIWRHEIRLEIKQLLRSKHHYHCFTFVVRFISN